MLLKVLQNCNIKVENDHNSVPQQRRPGNSELGHCIGHFPAELKAKKPGQKKKAPYIGAKQKGALV